MSPSRRRWIAGSGRQPDGEPAAGAQHAPELGDVAQRQLGPGQVLEDDVAHRPVEAAVGDPGQGRAVADQPGHVAQVAVQAAGALEHLRADVERGDPPGARRERAGQAPEAAAEVEDVRVGADDHAEGGQEGVEVALAVGEEAPQVALAVRLAAVDEVDGVLAGPGVPEVAHRTHRAPVRNASGAAVLSAPVPTAEFDRLEETAALLEAPAVRRRMLVVVNPYATTMSDRLRSLVVAALGSRYDVTAVDTEAQGHATELARSAVDQRFDVVVSFGGDGTLNEVANGLADSDVPLSVLPGGATNVFCKMLGIPGEIVDATEHLLRVADDWRPRQVDLAQVNGRWFTFSAGFGLDATVVRAVDLRPARKHRFGEWYFAWAAVSTFLRRYLIRPPRVEALIGPGDAAVGGINVVVQNSDPFTYFGDKPLRGAEGATLGSGDLAGIVLHRAGPVDVPTMAFRLFSRRARVVDHRQVTPFSGRREVVARSVDGRPVPLQLDGDWVGDVTEARFAIEPLKLTVVA
jgi:diacylglycerol kinase family enzyme